MSAAALLSDPVEFIHKNLLIVTDPDVWYPKQHQLDNKLRARLTLVDMVAEDYSIKAKRSRTSSFFGKITGKGTKSPARGLYRVVMAGNDTPPGDVFLAYICPYKANSGSSMVLGQAANIMVTAEMSGCTFGIGSEGGLSKARMVMHANSEASATGPDAAGMMPQVKAQHELVSGGLGKGAKMWKPNQYRKVDDNLGTDVRSTIVGIRSAKSGSWHFYAQKYDTDGAQKTMLSVVKIC